MTRFEAIGVLLLAAAPSGVRRVPIDPSIAIQREDNKEKERMPPTRFLEHALQPVSDLSKSLYRLKSVLPNLSFDTFVRMC
jgi:hypothetical protein